MLAEDPAGPALMGALIETGSRFGVFLDYALGAARMLIASAVAARGASPPSDARSRTSRNLWLRPTEATARDYAAWPFSGASITRAFSRAKLFGVMYQLK